MNHPTVDPLNLRHAQDGLGWFPDHAIYATFHLRRPEAFGRKDWQAVVHRLDGHCAAHRHRSVVLCGVGLELWARWADDKHPAPHPAAHPQARHCTGIRRHPSAFASTGGDLWFHIKSETPEHAAELLKAAEEALGDKVRVEPDRPVAVTAQKRHGGKVLGGRFIDGLENPADREDLSARVVLGPEHQDARGGAFVVSQRFVHDWAKLDAMVEQQKQNMIGRDGNDRILAISDDSSHIKRARQMKNGERMNMRLVRQALPYGQATANRANEEGIMFAGYAQSWQTLDEIFERIAGDKEGFVQDQLFSVTRGVEGSYFYLPSRKECGLDGEARRQDVTMNPYFALRSDNGLMFYNARDYQARVRRSALVKDCPISERILTLLNKQFSRWQDTWYEPRETPPVGRLADHLAGDEKSLLTASVALRKGKATQITLSKVVVAEDYARRANLLRVDPDDLFVGNMPQLSLGIGSQVMEYLSEEERITQWFGSLNEYSATGHNVPDYALLLRLGIGGLLALYTSKLEGAKNPDFFQSMIWSLQGLQGYIDAHAACVQARLDDPKHPLSDAQRANLAAIVARLGRLRSEPAVGFVDGLQLVYLFNCALHLIGEPHSIGRLDQFTGALYEADLARGAITPALAQEAIDAFWLKMDETVLYNYRHLNDYLTYGSGAVFYSAGNFPQGAAINQWVQQVTVGGVKAEGGAAQDASNAVTRMCLRAARRLPLNAPCLSLRVHANTPPELLDEAASALLSGGAHPVLLNDDKLVPALAGCMPKDDGLPAERHLADARDYSCDGCYEPVFPGLTEWAFSYVPLLPMVDFAMNQGTSIQAAGPIHLRGNKQSWNSPPPEQIVSFEEFLEIFHRHWRWAVSGYFHSLVNGYGALAGACPSPLFSSLMTDAADSGHDLVDGGARYHVVALMMCGMSDAIDSLYAIRKLVFDPDTARCTLPELLRCLQCDWGFNMQAPFFAASAGAARLEEEAERFKQLREVALALPKFGINADAELVQLAEKTIQRCVDAIHAGLDGAGAVQVVKDGYAALKKKYGSDRGGNFAFTVTPGVGTFEDNVGVGMGMGASANGRRNAQPLAADGTAMPLPPDRPLPARTASIARTMGDWNMAAIGHGIANAAPPDLNIAEDFPHDQLVAFLRDFAQGRTGSNMMTISCASPSTLAAAMQEPERYDLVRMRTGGWSEFYVAMFDFHQEYLRRRTFYVP